MASTRQAFVWALYGKTGSGKTSFAIFLAKIWRKCNKGFKVIGFDPHGNLAKAGILDHKIQETDTNWAEVLMTRICNNCNRIKHPEKDKCTKCGKEDWRYKFQGCLLILDDYRSLLAADATPADVLRLFALKRKLGLDMMIIMHNPKMLILRIATYVTKHLLFATQSLAGQFSDRITEYVSCQKAANLINQYVLEMGGVDCDKYRKMHPNFPYVMVHNDSETLQCENMDQNIVNRLISEGKI